TLAWPSCCSAIAASSSRSSSTGASWWRSISRRLRSRSSAAPRPGSPAIARKNSPPARPGPVTPPRSSASRRLSSASRGSGSRSCDTARSGATTTLEPSGNRGPGRAPGAPDGASPSSLSESRLAIDELHAPPERGQPVGVEIQAGPTDRRVDVTQLQTQLDPAGVGDDLSLAGEQPGEQRLAAALLQQRESLLERR